MSDFESFMIKILYLTCLKSIFRSFISIAQSAVLSIVLWGKFYQSSFTAFFDNINAKLN